MGEGRERAGEEQKEEREEEEHVMADNVSFRGITGIHPLL